MLALAALACGPAPRETAAEGAAEAVARRPACATLFITNDEHGYLRARRWSWSGERPAGGAAAVAGRLRAVRDSSPCPVFLVSAGDMLQGAPISSLFRGRPAIEVFNRMGYDAAAVGNHEFDWGIDTLEARIAEARFPFLGANVFLRGTDRHPRWIRPWTIVERGGVRIGFVGLAGTHTPWTTRPEHVEALEFRSIPDALRRTVPRLRERGVDFVVALVHEGGFCDRTPCEGEVFEALRSDAPAPDFVVSGHTHSRIGTEVEGTPVIQARSYLTAYGLGHMERADGVRSARIGGVQTVWPDEVAPDSGIAALVDRWSVRVDSAMDRPVAARLAAPLPKVGGARDGFALGRLIADAQRAATGDEVALMNDGGIRTGLDAGAPTWGELFQVHPFENRLVRLELDGARLLEALEHAVSGDDPAASISGLVVRWDPGAPTGRRVVSAILESGRTVRPGDTVGVTVNDFMAAGGSGYDMLDVPAHQTGILDLEALVWHLESLPQPVTPPEEPRWIPIDAKP